MSLTCDSVKIVVGLDFGTTYSGFAFAHRIDPEDVHLFFEWPNANRPYCKTHTSLYYGPNEDLRGWSWSGFHEYTKALQEFRSKWRGMDAPSVQEEVGNFATQFKLLLSDDPLPSDGGLSAEKLIVDYLRSMSEFIMAHLTKKYGMSLSKRDVQWCLTVPAIWSDVAKEKMKAYAEKAGLVTGKYCSCLEASVFPLRIILEPEAASFACQKHLKDVLSSGDKFIVADLGGGTIDVVVHEKASAGYTVREVSASSGDLGGGTFVDRNFFELLKKKISCFEVFSKNEPETILRILEWWLGPWGKCSFDGTGCKVLDIPRKLSKAWMEADHFSQDDGYYEELEISNGEMKAIFDTEVKKVSELIEKELSKDAGIERIVLVGGFSENEYVQKEIKMRFGHKQVIIPPNPGAAICKGAVAIGLGTGVVLSRISKRWYGIKCSDSFRIGKDPASYKFLDDDGHKMCDNRWANMVNKDEAVAEESFVSEVVCPVYRHQKELGISLLSSTSDERPEYTTDSGCKKLETYSFDINHDLHLGKNREVKVIMYFGRSSIEVSAQRLNFGSDREPQKLYSVQLEASAVYT